MGCYDIWCPICGCPLNDSVKYNIINILKNKSEHSEDYVNFLKKINTSWLMKTTILLENKKAEHGFKEVNCNTGFEKNNKTYELHPELDEYSGIPVHTDCWKYAKKMIKHNLQFEDFQVEKKVTLKKKKSRKVLKTKSYKIENDALLNYVLLNSWEIALQNKLNYEPAIKYWEQQFDINSLGKNIKDWYILSSPLSNNYFSKKNGERILKNIKKIHSNVKEIKKPIKNQSKKTSTKDKSNRPSPSQSATIFKVGTKKKGNDGNMWIIKKNKNGVNRWSKIN